MNSNSILTENWITVKDINNNILDFAKLKSFEESLYSDLKTDEAGKTIASEIRETKALPSDCSKLDNYLKEFKKRFM